MNYEAGRVAEASGIGYNTKFFGGDHGDGRHGQEIREKIEAGNLDVTIWDDRLVRALEERDPRVLTVDSEQAYIVGPIAPAKQNVILCS